MVEFNELKGFNISDIERLINDEVEESIHLDYKASGSLAKDDKKRAEITKDVSAFANSDGGIIIYGLSEIDHKPQSLSFINGNILTKEWLESVINMIQPRIKGIEIYPIRHDGYIEKSLYVVKIPRSDNAPHMAKDNRFYRRYNFMSVPMEEYEVKDLYSRKATPNLEIDGCAFYKTGEDEKKGFVDYQLQASIVNTGNTLCETYKLSFYINNPCFCNYSYKPMETKHSFTYLGLSRLKITCPSIEPIFNGETLDLGHVTIHVKKELEKLFFDKLIIDMNLFYPGGQSSVAYYPKEERFIDDIDEIEKLIEENTIKENQTYLSDVESNNSTISDSSL